MFASFVRTIVAWVRVYIMVVLEDAGSPNDGPAMPKEKQTLMKSKRFDQSSYSNIYEIPPTRTPPLPLPRSG